MTQVKGKSKRPYVIVGVVVLLLAAMIGGWYYFKVFRSGPKVVYKEHRVERGSLEVFVQATGQVQPENRLVVKPSIPGRIEQVLVDEGKQVKAGEILAWMSSNDRAALLDMAKAKGEDEVAHWKDIYKASPIVAPLAGFVIAKNLESGQVVATSDTAFVISNRLVINAQVDETDLARVHLEQPASIVLDAYADTPVPGRVSRIAFEARTANNVTIYDIRILPSSVPAFMRSGMTASVKFMELTKENVVKIPVGALKKSLTLRELKKPGQKATVFVKLPSNNDDIQFETKEITLGATDSRYVEVTSGLNGDEIILEDQTPESTKSNNPFSPFGTKKPASPSSRGGR